MGGFETLRVLESVPDGCQGTAESDIWNRYIFILIIYDWIWKLVIRNFGSFDSLNEIESVDFASPCHIRNYSLQMNLKYLSWILLFLTECFLLNFFLPKVLMGSLLKKKKPLYNGSFQVSAAPGRWRAWCGRAAGFSRLCFSHPLPSCLL